MHLLPQLHYVGIPHFHLEIPSSTDFQLPTVVTWLMMQPSLALFLSLPRWATRLLISTKRTTYFRALEVSKLRWKLIFIQDLSTIKCYLEKNRNFMSQ